VNYIANIVSEVELANHKKLEWVNYIKFDSSIKGQVHLHVNMAVPTLIVGWSLFKNEFAFMNPNILKHEGYNQVQWVFSMEEKMTEHFKGVEKFVKTAPRKYVETKPYHTIDPIKDNILNADHVLIHLNGMVNLFHCDVYQYKEEIIYIYDRTRFEITGIYLNSFRYFQYDVERIKDLIYSRVQENPNNIVTKDADGLIYQSHYKHFPEFDQLKRTMVLFLP
jgi:hypothetical protein